ncbi:hypothetical protein C8F01DRAFT_1242866 [Mycena amicta]|nr:hypothetical protein C8F01DRAFT_1242866 [Mycena amicta]
MATLSGGYLNSDERNIHIWASDVDDSGARYIVGGCHTWEVEQGAVPLTNRDLYMFLGIIVTDVEVSDGFQPVLLGPCPMPRNSPPNIMLPQLGKTDFMLYTEDKARRFNNGQQGLLAVNDSRAALPGEYLFFLRRNLQPRDIEVNLPSIEEAEFTSRAITRADTGTASASESGARRSSTLAPEVRGRDLRCVVGGMLVPLRARGPNYKSFHAAHIVAYAQLEEENDVDDADEIRNSGDTPKNAILMQSHFHHYFDDYQFSFSSWDPNAALSKFTGYKFERQGAGPFDAGKVMYRRARAAAGQPNRNGYDSVNPLFMRQHFRTCVLWHVAGLGREQGR